MPWLILAFLAASGGGIAYHQVTVSKLENEVIQLEANNRTLKENQIQMQVAVETSQKALADVEAMAKKTEAAMSSLTAKNMQLQRDKDNAMRIFKDHNLTRLARAKPGMIEKRANAKTSKVFRELENDTKELMSADSSESDSNGVQLDSEISDKTSSTGTANSNGS